MLVLKLHQWLLVKIGILGAPHGTPIWKKFLYSSLFHSIAVLQIVSIFANILFIRRIWSKSPIGALFSTYSMITKINTVSTMFSQLWQQHRIKQIIDTFQEETEKCESWLWNISAINIQNNFELVLQRQKQRLNKILRSSRARSPIPF